MIFKKELFGALNDGSGKVRIYIDRFFEGNLMDAHPNDNAATMFLKADDVIGFLRSTGRTADYIDLPDGAERETAGGPDAEETEVRRILTSQCLFGGEPVRYDGKCRALGDPIYLKWKSEGRLVAVCPEVFGGLPTPRPEAQIVGDRVINREGTDVTDAYMKGAREAVRLAKAHNVAFAVMKEKSPSCGSSLIYDGTFRGEMIPGEGLAARLLREAGFRIFSEDELEEAAAYLETI